MGTCPNLRGVIHHLNGDVSEQRLVEVELLQCGAGSQQGRRSKVAVAGLVNMCMSLTPPLSWSTSWIKIPLPSQLAVFGHREKHHHFWKRNKKSAPSQLEDDGLWIYVQQHPIESTTTRGLIRQKNSNHSHTIFREYLGSSMGRTVCLPVHEWLIFMVNIGINIPGVEGVHKF